MKATLNLGNSRAISLLITFIIVIICFIGLSARELRWHFFQLDGVILVDDSDHWQHYVEKQAYLVYVTHVQVRHKALRHLPHLIYFLFPPLLYFLVLQICT